MSQLHYPTYRHSRSRQVGIQDLVLEDVLKLEATQGVVLSWTILTSFTNPVPVMKWSLGSTFRIPPRYRSGMLCYVWRSQAGFPPIRLGGLWPFLARDPFVCI
ncbi:hypothetical protein MAA_11056 [Metarhizium robertsii ARSEF 23]|uniref:Uncharacterized protein n=1 Tax=Metarhizium robertsii (strain ARSEF 23 / ATCC MYA-3075) TaxID=655844 RepID=A0A0B2XH66_METRA|nr:uncharacterized protein MAA_11056 [Metarhizium robertsii ARSEF 23]KHO11241.1 hypothetical protein MAA_11056 [Metarhizium robertsii ARSEF 23]